MFFHAVTEPSASSFAPMNLPNQSTDADNHLINVSEENHPETVLLIFSKVAARLLFLMSYSLISDVPVAKELFDKSINSLNLAVLLPMAPITLLAPSALIPNASNVFAVSVAFIPFIPSENCNMNSSGLVLIILSTSP